MFRSDKKSRCKGGDILYKAGTYYGTVSPKEIYKAGTIYGSISIYDF